MRNHVALVMASKQSLSPSTIKKAKEALSVLNSLVGDRDDAKDTSRVQTARDDREESPQTRRHGKLMKAADRALEALRGLKRRKGSEGKRPLKSEVINAKRAKKCAWKHRFVCLAWKDQGRVPTTDTEKDDLMKAGLGEKTIEFSSLDMSAEEFRDEIYSAFPKLQEGGGFHFCKCIANTRKLELLSPVVHSSPALLKERVSNARTYIRPLQCDLAIDEEVDLPDGPKEKCLLCGLELPLSALKDHIDRCEKELRSLSPLSSSTSSAEDLSHGLTEIGHTGAGSSTGPVISQEDVILEHEFVQAAIKESMSDVICLGEEEQDNVVKRSGDDGSNIATEIRSLQSQLLDSPLCLDIRRDYVLVDALREARKKKFDSRKRLKVTFVGEGAIDHGGPRREFFRLFALKSSEEYFHGPEGKKFFVNNVMAVQNNDFFYLGQYVAMSIAQGGNGFPFLSKVVYSYIASGKYTNIDIDLNDIPDPTLQFALVKINGAEDNDEMKAVLAIEEVQDFIFQTGFRKAIKDLTVDNKKELTSIMVDYHLMAKVKCCMDQFIDGLQALGLLGKIQVKPSLWEPLFCSDNSSLTVDALKAIFKMHFSDKGCNRRVLQEQTYVFFTDFLDECADGEVGCSIEDICVFFSGSSCVPPLGFEKQPVLSFHDGMLATASTCELHIRLPMAHKNYPSFRDAMILSIRGNDGFGGV